MSVETLCAVCQAAPADHRCPRCGDLVCAEHFDETVGTCAGCAADGGDRRDRRDPDVTGR